jgi:hypothetical protein
MLAGRWTGRWAPLSGLVRGVVSTDIRSSSFLRGVAVGQCRLMVSMARILLRMKALGWAPRPSESSQTLRQTVRLRLAARPHVGLPLELIVRATT